jgi:hypothetical protein
VPLGQREVGDEFRSFSDAIVKMVSDEVNTYTLNTPNKLAQETGRTQAEEVGLPLGNESP